MKTGEKLYGAEIVGKARCESKSRGTKKCETEAEAEVELLI
jgi:hypothetical protein